LALRIAFDLDGVLADMESELVRQAEAVFGEVMTRKLQERADARQPAAETDAKTPAPDDMTEASDAGEPGDPGDPQAAVSSGLADTTPPIVRLDMTARQERKVWRHVASIEDFWMSLNEIEPGVVSRLAGIAADRRWEIIFLTKRPQTAGATAQVQSQRWLESKGFVLPSVYVVQGSRGRIAAALGIDIVIDDRPENCLDVVVDSKARAILVWRGDERSLPVAARRLGIGVVKSVGECLDILTELDAAPPRDSGVLARVKRMLGLLEPA
jgi:hypothetical protein